MSSWSPRRSTVWWLGHEAVAVAHDEGDVGALGQPQLEHLDAAQLGRGPRPSPGAGPRRAPPAASPRRRGRGAVVLGDPSRRATHGRVGALDEREDDDEHEDEVEDPLDVPACPTVSGTVASTTGTAPRSPAQERNAWSRHGIRNGVQRHDHRQRPGHQQQHQPDDDGGRPLGAELARARRAGRAGRTARSGPASRAPSAKPRTAARAGAAGCPAPAPAR